jgi:hypothetical protein
MAGGNLSVSQEKILALQDNNLKIQQELNRILTERKKKTEGEKANVSS